MSKWVMQVIKIQSGDGNLQLHNGTGIVKLGNGNALSYKAITVLQYSAELQIPTNFVLNKTYKIIYLLLTVVFQSKKIFF